MLDFGPAAGEKFWGLFCAAGEKKYSVFDVRTKIDVQNSAAGEKFSRFLYIECDFH